MKSLCVRALSVLVGTLCAVGIAQADVRLPAVIGDHMVLQRDISLPIWGWATPGEKVSVTFAGSTQQATADDHGRWQVKFPPMKASAKPAVMTVAGKNKIEVKDILVGEVWIGSGQSNMQWSLKASTNGDQAIASAKHPNIRLFTVPMVPSGTPAADVKSHWDACTPQTVPSFSGVLYFFGQELHKELDVPVGLINTSWGGTQIQPWTPPSGFAGVPGLKPELDQLHANQAKYQTSMKNHLAKIKEWVAAADKAVAAGHDLWLPPAPPAHPLDSRSASTGLYNGMVHPLVPFAIRGVIWYQGESNNGQGMHYFDMMKGLIQGWRTEWNQGDFPFLFVQLAPYHYGTRRTPTDLPGIWEAQTASLAIPNTGMAVTTDVGNPKDIHPRDKQTVGHRLALWALSQTYHKPELVYSGPLFESQAVAGSKVTLKFKHAKGLKSLDGKPLTWFSIAGADKKFVPATATIVGETVVVESPEVSSPVAVRFGWNQIAEPNLANGAGLPASPFRTDKWSDATKAPVAAK